MWLCDHPYYWVADETTFDSMERNSPQEWSIRWNSDGTGRIAKAYFVGRMNFLKGAGDTWRYAAKDNAAKGRGLVHDKKNKVFSKVEKV